MYKKTIKEVLQQEPKTICQILHQELTIIDRKKVKDIHHRKVELQTA